jgi:hypothetical protein
VVVMTRRRKIPSTGISRRERLPTRKIPSTGISRRERLPTYLLMLWVSDECSNQQHGAKCEGESRFICIFWVESNYYPAGPGLVMSSWLAVAGLALNENCRSA